EEIILGLKEGNENAFKKVFSEYKTPLFVYLKRMVHDSAKAEDLLQEVFIKILINIKKYNHKGRFKQWIFRIAANITLDYLRKTKREKNVISNQHNICNVTEIQAQYTTGGEQAERIQNAVKELPEEQRSVFLLRQFSGLSFNEIAQVEKIPINTALSRMRYALKSIRNYLEVNEKVK
ncbi:MAG: sigma-70 family RNA polymerase sigma factor, partial [Planctomycetota bacterium]